MKSVSSSQIPKSFRAYRPKALQWLGRSVLSVLGWKVHGKISDEFNEKKLVVIVAPHTSNWDFFYARLYSYIVKIQPKYLAKKELFVPFISYLIKLNGGIPVDRSKKNKLVDFLSKKIIDSKTIILSLSPEGTRKKVDKWKTGFYYIAQKANVPIVIVGINYKKKEIGIIDKLFPTNNFENDMKRIQEQLTNISGKIEKNFNPVIY